jgi:hypothetical protein
MARCTGFILTSDTIIRVAKVSSPRIVGPLRPGGAAGAR